MAHRGRKRANSPESEAERFLDNANDMLRDARIDGIEDVTTVRAYLKYECTHQERSDVIQRLEDRLKAVRPE